MTFECHDGGEIKDSHVVMKRKNGEL